MKILPAIETNSTKRAVARVPRVVQQDSNIPYNHESSSFGVLLDKPSGITHLSIVMLVESIKVSRTALRDAFI